MKGFHMLLLASAMLLSFGSTVVLAQYPGDDVYDYDYDYYLSDKDNDFIEINKRFLTPRRARASGHYTSQSRKKRGTMGSS